MNRQFKIKICGITNLKDATLAVDAGADCIGINFYPKSLRHVTKMDAQGIVDGIRENSNDEFAIAGVFVNESPDSIRETVDQTGINWIQLHGDETPEWLDGLADLNCIRAIRSHQRSLAEVRNEIDSWIEAGIQSVLLDSGSAKEYGGTGIKLDWHSLSEMNLNVPWILAGGLDSENVSEAIRTANPAAVDVASGIEGFPGKKDPEKTKQFIENALEAFSGN